MRFEERQEQVCTKGFGISYDWITQADTWSGDLCVCWDCADGYFKGVSKEDFDRMLETFKDIKIEHIDTSGRDTATINTPYRDDRWRNLVIPDHLFNNAPSENIPAPKEMAGEYDIIYYGGKANNIIRTYAHNRTARGTLKLSEKVNGNGSSVIAGTVTMDPCMGDIDVIPFGGNYGFEEKTRVQRQGQNTNDYHGDTTSPTGIVHIIVTNPPDGLCTNSGYTPKDNVYLGELKVFKEKVGAGITEQIPVDHSIRYPRIHANFNSTEEANALNRVHNENTCSWLHNHTILDEQAAREVGKFICPPPVFFFLEGDIQIDVNWRRISPRCGPCDSCIIARRRRASANRHCSPGLLISNDKKFEEQMMLMEADIEKLERRKEMVWLAYKCAEILREDNNFEPSCSVLFSVHEKRVKRCLSYLDTVFFDEQLSLYDLQLVERRFNPDGEHSEFELEFSRINMTM